MHDQKAITLNNRLPEYTLSCREALVHAHIAHRENISPETRKKKVTGGREEKRKYKEITYILFGSHPEQLSL